MRFNGWSMVVGIGVVGIAAVGIAVVGTAAVGTAAASRVSDVTLDTLCFLHSYYRK